LVERVVIESLFKLLSVQDAAACQLSFNQPSTHHPVQPVAMPLIKLELVRFMRIACLVAVKH
jgi:hypothetical protein